MEKKRGCDGSAQKVMRIDSKEIERIEAEKEETRRREREALARRESSQSQSEGVVSQNRR